MFPCVQVHRSQDLVGLILCHTHSTGYNGRSQAVTPHGTVTQPSPGRHGEQEQLGSGGGSPSGSSGSGLSQHGGTPERAGLRPSRGWSRDHLLLPVKPRGRQIPSPARSVFPESWGDAPRGRLLGSSFLSSTLQKRKLRPGGGSFIHLGCQWKGPRGLQAQGCLT